MKQKLIKLNLILFLMFSLTGCGFHLRGSAIVPNELKIMYLDSFNSYDPFTQQLKSFLVATKTQLTAKPQDAPVTLYILGAEFTQQLTSISSNTQVRTYNLVYTATFQLQKPNGQVIYGPVVATAIAPYSTSDTQLLANSQNLVQQAQQLRSELIAQLFNYLNSQQARTALAQLS